MKLAFIGGGNMACALIQGLLQHGLAAEHICVIEMHAQRRAELNKRFGVVTDCEPTATLAAYDAWILAVKPGQIAALAQQLQPYLPASKTRTPSPHPPSPLIISIAAGVRAADLSRWLGGYTRIVRAMPNTPALIGQGITGAVLFQPSSVASTDTAARDLAQSILTAVGEVFWYEEEAQIDALTAISGSGPAYIFYFMEALEEAAQTLGFSAEQSQKIVRATFCGATQLAAQSSDSVSALREQVTSPGGTTAAALDTFNQQHLKTSILKAVQAAHHRAQAMGNEMGTIE